MEFKTLLTCWRQHALQAVNFQPTILAPDTASYFKYGERSCVALRAKAVALTIGGEP